MLPLNCVCPAATSPLQASCNQPTSQLFPLFLSEVGAAVMAFGFYKVGQTNRKRRAVKAAHYEARAALVPFLQARTATLCFVFCLLCCLVSTLRSCPPCRRVQHHARLWGRGEGGLAARMQGCW